MTTLVLNVKALSVNDAWQGRRFSTPAKKKYDLVLQMCLPQVHVAGGPYYRIEYDFHLVNFAMTDYDNCIKVTQDCLVKQGIITDDRFIVDARVRKYRAKQDRIVIRIEGCECPQ